MTGIAPRWLRRPREKVLGPKHHVVVAIAGHAGSGKSALAAAVTEGLNSSATVSFKDVIASKSLRRRNASEDPDALVREGQAWVDRDPKGLVRAVMGRVAGSPKFVVVDGVHHEVIRRELERLVSPTPVMLVLLKTTRGRFVSSFKDQGKSSEEALRLLAGSTEAEVDTELLSQADLVLDGTLTIPENAQRVLQRAATGARVGMASSLAEADYAGGLSRYQRSDLVKAVAAEWGWLLPAELLQQADGEMAATDEELDLDMFGLDVQGAVLVPGFVSDRGRREVARAALHDLRGRLSDWETLAWLLAENGWLDGRRPIDEEVDDVQAAAQHEMAQL